MKRVILVACMALLPTVGNAQVNATTQNPKPGSTVLLPEGDNFPSWICDGFGMSGDPEDTVTVIESLEFMDRQVAVSDPQIGQGGVYATARWTPPDPNSLSGDTETTIACRVSVVASSGRSAADYHSSAWRHTKYSFAQNYSFDTSFLGPPWHWLINPGCQHRVANSGRWNDWWTFNNPFSLVATLSGVDHHLIVFGALDNWYPWAFDFQQDLSSCNYLQIQ